MSAVTNAVSTSHVMMPHVPDRKDNGNDRDKDLRILFRQAIGKIDDLTTEVRELKHEVKNLKQEVRELKQENAGLKTEIISLKKEVMNTGRKVEALVGFFLRVLRQLGFFTSLANRVERNMHPLN